MSSFNLLSDLSMVAYSKSLMLASIASLLNTLRAYMRVSYGMDDVE